MFIMGVFSYFAEKNLQKCQACTKDHYAAKVSPKYAHF